MRLQQALEGRFGFDDTLKETVAPDSDNLAEAAGLLYDILNESTRYAYDALEIEVNGDKKNISVLYHECVSLMKKASAGGAATEFLAMSVLEDTFRKTLPLCLVHLESLLDGRTDMVAKARRLREILASNPYKKEWEARSELYRQLMARIGLRPDDADYSDLTAIMDPLLDALTFYPTHVRHARVYRFRIAPGAAPDVPPAFSLHVSKFRSESDLVNSFMSCGKENAVAFAAVEHTYGDTENWFESWYNGGDGERMHNVMRNERVGRDEYLAMTDDYSRTVYLCAKAGGSLYLLTMPYHRQSYGAEGVFSDKTKYYYGRRAGYAPYQVFYDEPPAAPEDTAFLAVPRKGWLLPDIMDADQKVWLPAFLNETFTYFFKSGEVPCEDVYLPEERSIATPDGTDEYRCPVPETALVPTSTAIAEVRFRQEVRTPDQVFDKPYMIRLLDGFGIGPADVVANGGSVLSGLALSAPKFGGRIRQAYVKLLCDKVKELLEDTSESEAQIRRQLFLPDDVVARVLSGACDGFTTVTVHGRTDEKGNVKKTSISDCTVHRYGPRGFTVLWNGKPTSAAPPVVYRVRPKTSEDYALLLGLEPDQLAGPLRLYTDLQAFWDDYQHVMPRSMSWHRTVEPKALLQLNVCMSRTAWKQALKQKERAAKEKEAGSHGT